MKNIVVVGAGYVGMSIATMLSTKHKVILVEKDEKKIEKINKKISTIVDKDIEHYLLNKNLNLIATNDSKSAYKNASYIIIATPTDFNFENNFFDTSIVESVLSEIINVNKKALIIIKSTIPIGFTQSMNLKNNTNKIIFSPEFLREGSALNDNLNPSRIIFGGHKSDQLKNFLKILLSSIKNPDSVDILHTGSNEAEAIKLFANTYLAMRVAFFNELDTYSIDRNLNVKDLILGISLDERIGNYYNNPSFGYGGYCLPKDSNQLLSSFGDTPQNLISAIIQSNKTRKKFIVQDILKRNPKNIGCYRINMKSGSDNFRDAAVLDILKNLHKKNIRIKIYEPIIDESYYDCFEIENDIKKFKTDSDLIIVNRSDEKLNDIQHKIYSRDIFNIN